MYDFNILKDTASCILNNHLNIYNYIYALLHDCYKDYFVLLSRIFQ